MNIIINNINPVIYKIPLNFESYTFNNITLFLLIFLPIWLASTVYSIYKGEYNTLYTIYDLIFNILMAMITLTFFIVIPMPFLQIKWYGIGFALNILCIYLLFRLYMKNEFENGARDADAFYFIGVSSMLITTRIVHIVFYGPITYYLTYPDKIFKIWEGGVASHGAILGAVIAIIIYVNLIRPKYTFCQIADGLALSGTLTPIFIRLGNYANSEIVGKVTDVPWGVLFVRYDYQYLVNKTNEQILKILDGANIILRHPAQIYEVIVYIISACIMFYFYKKIKSKNALSKMQGFLSGLYLILFSFFRMIIENFKEYQVLDPNIGISMGFILSIPFIIIGFVLLYKSYISNKDAVKLF